MKVLIASWNRTDSISSLREPHQNTLLRQSVPLVQEKSKHTFWGPASQAKSLLSDQELAIIYFLTGNWEY